MGWGEERINPHLDPWRVVDKLKAQLKDERLHIGELNKDLAKLRAVLLDREAALEELSRELIFYKGF